MRPSRIAAVQVFMLIWLTASLGIGEALASPPVADSEALIESLPYKPDAQASESSNTAAHHSLARRACMNSLLAFRKITIKADSEDAAEEQSPPEQSISSSGERSDLVRIGVLAKRGRDRCLAQWGLTAEYLSNEIPAYRFEVVPLDFDEIYATVQRGDVDFILTNPAFYVGLEKRHGASPIATLKNIRLEEVYTVFAGVVFCRADREDIRQLHDLAGKTFMAFEETSFGGWLMAWRELEEQGINPRRHFKSLEFGGTHDAVVLAVLRGDVDAGTVRTDTLERMEMEGKIRLDDFRVLRNERVGTDAALPFLHSTRAYPEWPFAKASHTTDELADQVSIALLRMRPESPAAQAARCAGWTSPFQYQEVRECLKELRVGPYRDYGRSDPQGSVSATLAMGPWPGGFYGDHWCLRNPRGTAQ